MSEVMITRQVQQPPPNQPNGSQPTRRIPPFSSRNQADEVFDLENDSGEDMVPYTITEFRFVQENFANNDDLAILQAMYDVLMMWEWRMERATLLIDITKIIVQGLKYDKRYVDRSDADEDAEGHLCLIYGMIITRFVNYIEGIRRTNQSSNILAMNPYGKTGSMIDAARDLGLPDEVVETRHALVHKTMPTLSVLRKCIQACREWLWDVHWKMPIEIALNVIGTAPKLRGTPKVRKIKPAELRISFGEYAAGKLKRGQLEPAEQARHRRQLLELQMLVSNDTRNAAAAFATGFLLSRDQLIKLGEEQPTNGTAEVEWTIPVKWRLFWAEIIEIMEELGVIGFLIQHMSELSWKLLKWWPRLQYAAWVKHCIGRMKLTGCRLADWSVSKIADNMANAGLYYKWSEIEEFLDSSKSTQIDVQSLRRKWESSRRKEHEVITLDDDVTMNFSSISDRENWSLVAVPQPLGLADGQTAATLNLCVQLSGVCTPTASNSSDSVG